MPNFRRTNLHRFHPRRLALVAPLEADLADEAHQFKTAFEHFCVLALLSLLQPHLFQTSRIFGRAFQSFWDWSDSVDSADGSGGGERDFLATM